VSAVSVVRHRCRRWAASLLAVATLVATPAVASADPPKPHPSSPAASDVRKGHERLLQARRDAQRQEQRLDVVKQQVAIGQQQLTDTAAAARAAVDRYAATMKRVKLAEERMAEAQDAAEAAALVADRQQSRVQNFARATYMSGGPIASLAIVLSAEGPRRILNRAALLGQVSQSQTAVLHALEGAERREEKTAATAARAVAAVERTAARADRQRRAALVAMANQQALVARLTEKQATVTSGVVKQERHVAQIAHEQAAAKRAAVAAQRAALAAAWASMQHVGDSMPWATKEQGREAVEWAEKQLGVPYSWAGGDVDGPTLGTVNENGNPAGLHTVGFDCSGLTMFAWAHAGFTIDHYTGYQWVEGHRIPLDELRAGDLVFFAHDTSDPLTIHHVGIYVKHDLMIDAPHTGAFVRYDKVFVPGLIGAVRP
jgi:peptidoglycan DL-endopeptidase RipA